MQLYAADIIITENQRSIWASVCCSTSYKQKRESTLRIQFSTAYFDVIAIAADLHALFLSSIDRRRPSMFVLFLRGLTVSHAACLIAFTQRRSISTINMRFIAMAQSMKLFIHSIQFSGTMKYDFVGRRCSIGKMAIKKSDRI